MSDETPVIYVVYGRERGESETPHLQGYCELNSRIGLRALKRLLPNRCHLEVTRGSLEENQIYCKKQGDVFEEGTPGSGQGARTDLLSVKEDIDAGLTESAIADKHFGQWVRYSKAFQKYRALKTEVDRNWKTFVTVLWGETGTGKTRYVHDKETDIWSPGDFQWFDGYRGQEVVLIDDYRGEYPIQFLLKLLDRYPMQVPVKGSFVKWSPRRLYITSNVNPEDWYRNVDGRTQAALKRRLEEVTYIEDPLFDDIVLERRVDGVLLE